MKKLWVNIGIFFGCFLLLISCLGAVLVFAPGMELLGVMYIRSTSGSVNDSSVVSDAVNYKNISVNTDNVPVYIEFVQSYTLSINLVEEYDGFAKAGGSPYVKVSRTSDELIIQSFEYKPILFNSRSEQSGLFVKVPMYYCNNINVKSNKSAVSFSGNQATVRDINISSNGKITLSNDLNMNSLTLEYGNKPAVISDSVNMSGTVYAKSTAGDLTLPAGFTGKVEYVSTTGDLHCASCGQLSFNSKSGQVKGVGNDLPTIIGDCVINTSGSVTIGSIGGAGAISSNNGSVAIGEKGKIYSNRLSINTKAGKVNMYGVYTNAETTVATKYGKIYVEQAGNITISSKLGDIKVDSIISGKISTTSGDISVGLVTDKVNITTKGGDVTVGNLDDKTSSADITTKGGDVSIINAGAGEFNIITKSGDIDYSQAEGESAKLNIESERGEVNLEKISGETNVKTNGKIFASIYNITKPITLIGKNKDITVMVRQYCYCDLSSKKNIVSAPGLEGETKTYYSIPEGVNQYLKIQTERGNITVAVE